LSHATLKRGKNLRQLMIVRAPSLLPMLYSPRELEQELGVPSRTIREWIKKDLPYERDARGHLWINGIAFAVWVKQGHTAKPKPGLAQDEAYCFKCRRPVKLSHPQQLHKAKLIVLRGTCPNCSRPIHRGVHFG